MSSERSDGLTPAERAALEEPTGETAPPAEIEDRIVSVLRARGLIDGDAVPAGTVSGLGIAVGWLRLVRVAGAAAALGVAFLLGVAYHASRTEPAIVYLDRAPAGGRVDPAGEPATPPSPSSGPDWGSTPVIHWTGHYCEVHDTGAAHLCILEKTGPMLSQAVVCAGGD